MHLLPTAKLNHWTTKDLKPSKPKCNILTSEAFRTG